MGLLCTSLDRTDSPRIIIYEKSLLKVRSCTTDQLYTPGCACTGVRRANFFLVLRPAVPSGNTHTRKLTSMRSAYRYPEVQKPTGSAGKNSRSLHSTSIVRHPVIHLSVEIPYGMDMYFYQSSTVPVGSYSYVVEIPYSVDPVRTAYAPVQHSCTCTPGTVP